MIICVTGGAGYIGSHTCVALLEAGHQVTIVDNLDNSSELAVTRIREVVGEALGEKLEFSLVDLLDCEKLSKLFADKKFDSVIHFAGLKAVGESVQIPIRYYHNNITGTLNLISTMQSYGCKKLVFSSSATVYGDPQEIPVTETSPLQATNPYGRTKLFIEEILRDLQVSDPTWKIALLRYFNPVGAHPSGKIGEDPKGIPNNLMPYVQQVAVGRRKELTVFGNDYSTVDGTGVRDYIHVMDLASGHLAAVKKLSSPSFTGCEAYNLGTGTGTSVLQLVKAFGEAAKKDIPYCIGSRRPGDVAEVYAGTDRAEKELAWKAVKTIQDMCVDQWKWASNNPYGYSLEEGS